MAKVGAPEAGVTVVQETRTRTEPNAQPKQERTVRPPMWEYFDSLATPDHWRDVSIWMRRYEGSEPVFLDKLDGEQLAELCRQGKPFSQEFLKAQYGGGKFKFMVKLRGELIYSGEDRFSGEAIDPNTRPVPAANGHGGTSDLAQVMNRMMDFIERRENPAGGQAGTTLLLEGARSAMTIQAEGLRSASAAISSVSPAPPARGEMEDITRQFMQAAIAKMLNPSDPIETFAKMMAAMKGLGVMTDGGGGSIGLELVRALPDALGKIENGLKNYALAQQAQARIAELRVNPASLPARPPVAQPTGPTAPATVQATQPQAPSVMGENQRQPWQDLIETQIRNILARADTPDDAADQAITVVMNFDLKLLQFLVEVGEEGVMGMFQQSPILHDIADTAQLRAFIRRFIEIGKIELAPSAGPPATVQGGPLLVPDPQPAA
jgi:hypothetical protein